MQTEQDTMQVAAIDRFGGPESITLRRASVPAVGPDDVLIRVATAGVAKWDAQEREGLYATMLGLEYKFPYVLGWEGAGTVVAVGQRVSRLRERDRVYAASVPAMEAGLYAEYAAINAEHVALVPDKMTLQQAGVMAWDALTAISGLEDAVGLRDGETLMVFGASGGIGHIAVQLARHMGARVLAVASGDDGVALARRLGANAVVDGRKDDVLAAARKFAPDGLDAALVTAGGEVAERALEAVRDDGRAGCPNGVMPQPKVQPAVRLIKYDGRRDSEATARLGRWFDARPFEIHIARSFQFDQVVDAHRMLDTHFLGKIALRVSTR